MGIPLLFYILLWPDLLPGFPGPLGFPIFWRYFSHLALLRPTLLAPPFTFLEDLDMTLFPFSRSHCHGGSFRRETDVSSFVKAARFELASED